MVETHVYVDGVEICDMKPPPIDLDKDDWFEDLICWIDKENRWGDFAVIWTEDPQMNPETCMSEVWIGEIPNYRLRSLGEGCISYFTKDGFYDSFESRN